MRWLYIRFFEVIDVASSDLVLRAADMFIELSPWGFRSSRSDHNCAFESSRIASVTFMTLNNVSGHERRLPTCGV